MGDRPLHGAAPFAVALLLAGCAPVTPGAPPSPLPDAPPSDAGNPAPATGGDPLAGQRWTLADATDAGGAPIAALSTPGTTLVLAFADGQATATGTCNRMWGGYRVQGGTLRIERLAMTRMACKGAAMAAERAFAALLAQPLAFAIEERVPPGLVLRASDGGTTRWTGASADAASQAGDRMFLEVAPRRVPCSHPLIPDHRCLQVRTVAYDEAGVRQSSGAWEAMYDGIDGFEFREGERSVLRVIRARRENPAADASSLAYTLDQVIESETVAP